MQKEHSPNFPHLKSVLKYLLISLTSSSSGTIGRIERGERNASLELALRLARYLDISVEELFQINDIS